ncbi:DHHC zinc finger domain containing protein [Trichomonas vaginalis G3]|uniref:Palmitoyltransferase n=1 Tax=Trichomonas vaginalis (strain ATCC PRA-98 / G3) TaxID=412133 RepID=A2E3V0_TRIV3|nr:cysteine S-palmitoyltransferase protein [Trichomonas vaginalis G3]EAY12605.1 DHHC zinc finger domain containing protein [Trichomonas vaginalis G3]KAI5546968.1 cysteine S-palmitoyltransferase protein [Trichomonas vaginalis G3]|eukprot:XP_001324828.1 DHHC zinc finger domain containing protein [Trichomonas vaginalis G3]
MTILVLLFLSCYILGVLVGPGYIPYYYPRRYNKFNGKEPDYLSEFVTTIEQKKYIKSHKYPAYCHYVSDARRIAIRPDHLCIWFTVFIGKLNYKFFLLFNMYGFLYITTFSVFQVMAMINLVEAMVNPIYVIITIIYLLMGFVFSILTCIFFFDSMYNTMRGTTNYEIINKISDTSFHDGCCNNFEEVCGPRDSWFLWILPIPAFWGMDVYALTAESDPYKML